MSLHVDDFGGKSIVPVYCGNSICGTAFFVSQNKLLTAAHVLGEYIEDNSAMVAIIVDGEYKRCRVLVHQPLINHPDVAMLECIAYHCPQEYVLTLLASRFRLETEGVIIGYPQELGNGEDYFGVKVRNSRQMPDLKRGFDRMVVRIDSFGFNSYDGFSGAPVLNEFGMVIGIETDQLFNTLGYVSVNAFRDIIEPFIDEKIEENDDLYDRSPFGLRTCQDFVEKAYDKLKTRYNKRFHIENNKIERVIHGFCGYGFNETEKELSERFKNWLEKQAGLRKKYVLSFQTIQKFLADGKVNEDLAYDIEGLLYENDKYKLIPIYQDELRSIKGRMFSLIYEKKYFMNDKFLCVDGAAGSGKSHFLYHEVCLMAKKIHIYFFLGSDFSAIESAEQTICKIMGWDPNDVFEKLNEKMIADGKTAIFVIDALNEGAGTHFWHTQLPVLMGRIQRCSNLKLIVSVRELSPNDNMNEVLRNGWKHLKIDGFANRESAIVEYFDKYEIHANPMPFTKIEEFQNPLFLKMFCEAYYDLTEEERVCALRLPIYKAYLRKRNNEVSDNVDEDPKQDVTSRFIQWVASRSLEQFKCEDLPRQLAYKKSRRLCPYRTWSKNLLKCCLDSNLLREYFTDEGGFVDFEFDKMGDYLKAYSLIESKCDDSDRFNTLKRIFDMMDDDYHHGRDTTKKEHFITAFLSVWNPNESIWKRPEFVKGRLTSLLLSCQHLRNIRDKGNTLTRELIGNILDNNPDFLEPELIFNNFELYSNGLMNDVHTKLKNMTMAERDEKWTTKANGLFMGAAYQDYMGRINVSMEKEALSMMLLETWMLSASYPYLRAYFLRKLKALMEQYSSLVEILIEGFYDVNDPYILAGLYAAIYGVVVAKDDPEYTKRISERIYKYHYPEPGRAPNDIRVRHWTLKIIELGHHQDPNIGIWDKVQPPYQYEEDLFALIKDEEFGAKNYFGESYGSKRIDTSLYHWDFSRYVIGTNSSNTSRCFYKNGVPVNYIDIEHAIAFLIKHRFGWNDKLGEYDSDVPYQSGYENSMERIGKKYQWIGLNMVYAYLCDTCQVKINIWSSSEKFAEKNYPWYSPNKDYFDPTLSEVDEALNITHELFKVIEEDSTIEIEGWEWLHSETAMPTLYLSINDVNDDVWIPLHGYSTVKEENGEYERERFVFYNGILVKEEDYEALKIWAAKTNFYGRWMFEHQGSIDFKWNEYPWADSYLTIADEDEEPSNEGGIEMKLAYSAQLQEDYKGMPDYMQYSSTAYMPCRDMMAAMGWHTAERGVIKDRNNNVVAINRSMPGEPMRALVVRKELLDEYLKKKGLVLFWPLIGEKRYGKDITTSVIERLTGAASYSCSDGIIVMQPLRKEPPPPPPEKKEYTEKEYPFLSKELIKKFNEMEDKDLLDILTGPADEN